MGISDGEKTFSSVLTGEEALSPLCNFSKLYGAVLTCDEEYAREWYLNEYSHSCFAVSSSDGLRMHKNGFIVLIGYIRSAVLTRNKSSAVILMENTYIRAVENCTDDESIYRLFISAFREFCGRMNGDGNVSQNNELGFCTDYIMTNLRSTLTLSDIALHCGYNPSYLSRKFKQIYGVSITKYILNERLKAAADMLRYSDRSIAEISSLFKFSSQSHFQQEFKKNFKVTPLQYRMNK